MPADSANLGLRILLKPKAIEGAIRFPSKRLLSTKKLLLLDTSLLMACYFKPSVKELLVGSSFGDGILLPTPGLAISWALKLV